MNITFVSFQGIGKKGVPEGMVRLILPILNHFPGSDGYFVSHTPSNNKNIKSVFFLCSFLRKAALIFGKIFNLHYGLIRLFQEYTYDFFLTLSIQKATILITTAYVPKTALKNKYLGGINVFLAGNPYDRFINSLILSEKNKFKISFEDPYTYEKRLRFIDNFIKLQDHVITQTNVTYESFLGVKDNTRLSLQEIEISPNGEIFKESGIKKSSKLRFVYIAHTVWLKGLIYLIEAWNRVVTDDCELVVGGGMDAVVMREVEKYKNKNILFAGVVRSNEINYFFRKAHVCIVPSIIDDHPATINEAMYCGLPVITTEGCGSKTLIDDGENGFIVPIANANALAHKISWFIDNKDKIEVMSSKAKRSSIAKNNSTQYVGLADHIMHVIEKVKARKGIL